jgi:DNA-binding LacI/PurR family transcriptional regulator
MNSKHIFALSKSLLLPLLPLITGGVGAVGLVASLLQIRDYFRDKRHDDLIGRSFDEHNLQATKEAFEYRGTYVAKVDGQLLILAVIAALVVMCLCAILLWIRQDRDKARGALREHQDKQNRRARVVLFISPSLDGFYGEYLLHLVREAQEQAQNQTAIAILPYHHAEAGAFAPELELTSTLDRMDPTRRFIDGVFIIPKDPDQEPNKRALMELESKRTLPIVTLDVYPAADELAGYPCFVGGQESEGGKMAALKAHGILENVEPRDGEHRILILVGSCTPWESQRARSFEDALKAGHAEDDPRLLIHRTKALNYDERATYELLTRLDRQGANEPGLLHPLSYDLIFACSDAMALGAAKALREMRDRSGKPEDTSRRVAIIGYDGTARMTKTLEGGHDLLVATVCVNIRKQAKVAVSTMMRLIPDRETAGARSEPRRFQLVEPELWYPGRSE